MIVGDVILIILVDTTGDFSVEVFLKVLCNRVYSGSYIEEGVVCGVAGGIIMD
jgi:hypothetical protein